MLCAAACSDEQSAGICSGVFPLGCSDSPMVAWLAGWPKGFCHTEGASFWVGRSTWEKKKSLLPLRNCTEAADQISAEKIAGNSGH